MFTLSRESINFVTKCLNVLNGSQVMISLDQDVTFYVKDAVATAIRFKCVPIEHEGRLNISISYENFLSMVKHVSGNVIQFKLQENMLNISDSNIKINLVVTKHIESLDIDLHKDLGSALDIDATVLKDALDSIWPIAILEDHVETFANCVYFDNQGNNINIVATDAHRLAIAKINSTSNMDTCLVSKKALGSVKKLMVAFGQEITLHTNDTHIIAVGESIQLFIGKINREYPDYGSVIPETSNICAHIQRENILYSINAAIGILASPSDALAISLLQGCLWVRSESFKGSSESKVPIQNTSDHEVNICLNAKYLKDAILTFKHETIHVMLENNYSPIALKGKSDNIELLHVIMPSVSN